MYMTLVGVTVLRRREGFGIASRALIGRIAWWAACAVLVWRRVQSFFFIRSSVPAPGLSGRIWARRRLRVLNRMRCGRALGFGITSVGLLVLVLSILFKLLVEPAAVSPLAESVDMNSKDGLLRQLLEARHPSQEKDYELPARQTLPPGWERRGALRTEKNGRFTQSRLPAAVSTSAPAMATSASMTNQQKSHSAPVISTAVVLAPTVSVPKQSVPLILKLSKEAARAQQVGYLTRAPIELQVPKVAVVQVIAGSVAAPSGLVEIPVEAVSEAAKETGQQLVSANQKTRINAAQ